MLRQRLIVVIVAIPIIFAVTAYGQWLFAVMIVAFLTLAASEYGPLFRRSGQRPAAPLVIAGVAGMSIARYLWSFDHSPLILAALLLAAMTWHLVDYERGAELSATDFAITVTGILYLGWIGSYLISLRQVPDGKWWVLLALPTIMLSDGGAYFAGSNFGRHPMTPRLSPKKTWEGYLFGVVTGGVSGAGLAALWHLGAGPASMVTAGRGLALGLVIGAVAPLGDLGISMLKRQAHTKDTGTLVPGHGGALDRTDSWLWAGVLAYYFVTFFTS